MNRQPIEIMKHIFGYLPKIDLVLATRVCHDWKTLIEQMFHKNKTPSFDECIVNSDYYYMRKYLKIDPSKEQCELIKYTNDKILINYFCSKPQISINELFKRYIQKDVNFRWNNMIVKTDPDTDHKHLVIVKTDPDTDHKHLVIIKFFLDKGADINTDVLEWCMRYKYRNVLNFLVEKLYESYCKTNEDSNFKKLLFSTEIDLFHFSATHGYNEIINLLLKIENNTEVLNKALLASAQKGHLDIIKLLLENGADLRANNDEALCLSVQNGHIEVVKFLLEQGADIHAKNDKALHRSAQHGHIEVVKLLLEKGASFHNMNFTNMNFIVEHWMTTNFELPKEVYKSALLLCSKKGYLLAIERLLENGADIKSHINMALLLSAKYGHLEIVKFLLKAGADINAYNNWALHISAKYGHIEIVKILLEKVSWTEGANINDNNNWALRASAQKGHKDVVKLLLEKGADINVLSKRLQLKYS